METQKLYSECNLCPNGCGVDRTKGTKGICGCSSSVKVAWCGLHRGEEPPVSGPNGSGMIFFCGCPLHCRYCQNWQISSGSWEGEEVSENELAVIMLKLQEMGAHTLNLVTGTQYIPSIINALEQAKEMGFTLPVVWNSSGYETVDALKMIDPYIDLYLLDCKTLSQKVASVFCGRASYADAIVPVISFLRRRYKKTVLEDNRLEGVLVRHLVFPGCIEQTVDFIKWYADNFKDNFCLSLMTQFVPPKENPGFKPVTDGEYEMLSALLEDLDIEGFIQEREENEILWIPDFRKDQPFPESFAKPLPYFLEHKKSRA